MDICGLSNRYLLAFYSIPILATSPYSGKFHLLSSPFAMEHGQFLDCMLIYLSLYGNFPPLLSSFLIGLVALIHSIVNQPQCIGMKTTKSPVWFKMNSNKLIRQKPSPCSSEKSTSLATAGCMCFVRKNPKV